MDHCSSMDVLGRPTMGRSIGAVTRPQLTEYGVFDPSSTHCRIMICTVWSALYITTYIDSTYIGRGARLSKVFILIPTSVSTDLDISYTGCVLLSGLLHLKLWGRGGRDA